VAGCFVHRKDGIGHGLTEFVSEERNRRGKATSPRPRGTWGRLKVYFGRSDSGLERRAPGGVKNAGEEEEGKYLPRGPR